jgi:hypothetical protein
MILTIAIIVFVLWLVGFGFFRAAVGGAIHLLLLIAIIAVVWYFLAGHSRAGAATTSAVSTGRALVAHG